MDAIDSRSDLIWSGGGSQEVANTAYSFAKSGYVPKHFFGAMELQLDAFLEVASLQHVCNMCWSLGILGLAKEHEQVRQGARARAF
jgi:hypothetical protein